LPSRSGAEIGSIGVTVPIQPIVCRISGPLPFFWIGTVALLTFFFIGSVVGLLGQDGAAAAVPLLLLMLGALAWLWFVGLVWFSYEIRLTSDGVLAFRSVLRTIQVHAGDLVSIRPDFMDLGGATLVFRTTSRSLRAMRRMDGMLDLLTEVRAINPGLELRGV
jgi:hypothetical protein